MTFHPCMFRLRSHRFTLTTNVYTIPQIVKALYAHTLIYTFLPTSFPLLSPMWELARSDEGDRTPAPRFNALGIGT